MFKVKKTRSAGTPWGISADIISVRGEYATYKYLLTNVFGKSISIADVSARR